MGFVTFCQRYKAIAEQKCFDYQNRDFLPHSAIKTSWSKSQSLTNIVKK
jgi:hypothetical protein